MEQQVDYIEKKHKTKAGWKILIILVILIAIFMFLLPFIMEAIFVKEKVTFKDFFVLTNLANGIWTYYGGILAFIGTMIMGIFTYRQTQIAQEKSDEVNRLMLQMEQQRVDASKQMLEISKSKRKADELEKDKDVAHDLEEARAQATHFEIKILNYLGAYAKLNLKFINHNSGTISHLTPVEIKFENKELSSDYSIKLGKIRMEFEKDFLSSEEATKLEIDCPELLRISPAGKKVPYLSLKIQISFSYIDEKGSLRFCQATATIPDTTKPYTRSWEVESVG